MDRLYPNMQDIPFSDSKIISTTTFPRYFQQELEEHQVRVFFSGEEKKGYGQMDGLNDGTDG